MKTKHKILVTVHSLTFNDDYSTPYTAVFATQAEALEDLFDYLEIPDESRVALRKDWKDNGEFADDLINPFKKNDYDSYTISSHDLLLEIEIPIDGEDR